MLCTCITGVPGWRLADTDAESFTSSPEQTVPSLTPSIYLTDSTNYLTTV